MGTIILILYLATTEQAPVHSEIRGFATVKACQKAADEWLAAKLSRTDVYIASAYCEKGK